MFGIDLISYFNSDESSPFNLMYYCLFDKLLDQSESIE